jgi:hypothetical protein
MVCPCLYKAYGWCRSQWSLLHHICFHSEIPEVVEKTLFLVPGNVHYKFVSNVRYRQVIVENLVGDVHSPRKRSNPATAGRDWIKRLTSSTITTRRNTDTPLYEQSEGHRSQKRNIFQLWDLYKSTGHVPWGVFRKISHSQELQTILV